MRIASLRTLCSVAALAACAILATGCAVDVDANPSDTVAGSSAADPMRSPTASAAGMPSASGAVEVVQISGNGGTHDIPCNGKSYEISGFDGKFVFKGECGTIHISGNNNNVVAETANVVAIDGFDNTVGLKRTNVIEVTGNDNTVTYRDGNPQTTNTGIDNVIKRVQ